MKSTTSFEEFFGDVGELDIDELAQLSQAVAHGKDFGRWRTTRNANRTFVDGNDVRLCIVDGEAQKRFHKERHDRSGDPHMMPEDQAMRRKEMQRDD